MGGWITSDPGAVLLTTQVGQVPSRVVNPRSDGPDQEGPPEGRESIHLPANNLVKLLSDILVAKMSRHVVHEQGPERKDPLVHGTKSKCHSDQISAVGWYRIRTKGSNYQKVALDLLDPAD